MLLILEKIVAAVLLYLAKKNYKRRFCRKVGMKASEVRFWRQIVKLFIEGFVDFLFAVSLNAIYVIKKHKHFEELQIYLKTPQDTFNSVLAVFFATWIIIVPVYLLLVTIYYRDSLNSDEVRDENPLIFEDTKMSRNFWKAQLQLIQIIKKSCLVAVLLFLEKYPFFQGICLIAIELAFIKFLIE